MIVAFHQVSGKYFSSQIALKISRSSVTVSSGRCVRMLLCILSGPDAVWFSLGRMVVISDFVIFLLYVSFVFVEKFVFPFSAFVLIFLNVLL